MTFDQTLMAGILASLVFLNFMVFGFGCCIINNLNLLNGITPSSWRKS